MKGITNVEIREKFENIESKLEKINKKPKDSSVFVLFFSLTMLTALVGTLMMFLEPHPIFLFFTILGISQMIFLIAFRLFMND
ncbi:MAG: hypothetical protein DRN27_08780 [Thermoplasmata archaeon]|nr:MAG: hypothetical protein DRN27_08780 [Thermoplasmata archaeon]